MLRVQGCVEKFGELIKHVVDFNCIRVLHGRLFDILLIISYKNTNTPYFTKRSALILNGLCLFSAFMPFALSRIRNN